MNIKTYFKVVFLFLVSLSVCSQEKNISKWDILKGLPSNRILDITQDAVGYLWISTDKGLVKFDGIEFQDTRVKDDSNLFFKNDTLYIGTKRGLVVKTNASQNLYTSEKVVKVLSFKNKLFVVTIKDIYQFKNTALYPLQIHPKLNTSEINDIKFLKNDAYILSNSGLWKLDNIMKPKKIEHLISEPVVSGFLWDGKLVVAKVNSGLSLINDGYIEENIRTVQSISSVQKIKNEVWITSTDGGIEVRSLPSFSFKQKINKYNYIETNKIYTVFKDVENTIWVASDHGLYQFVSANFNRQNTPTVHFEDFFVNNKKRNPDLYGDQLIKLTTDQNNISITFKSINFNNSRQIKYRYQLNSRFSPWSTNNVLQLANLNPGKYSITIQSKIGKTKSAVKKIRFEIDEPFYKKGGFILSVVVVVLLLMYIGVTVYINSIKKKNEEQIKALKIKNQFIKLEQKALQLQMNPHFIFNVLNGIKALGNSHKTEEFNKVISQFSILLRNILQNSRKEYVSLQDEIIAIKNYLALEQRMSPKNFDYEITLQVGDFDLDEIQIPPMLIQPFLENAIQHGLKLQSKGTVSISIKIVSQTIHFTIIDNGIGFYNSQKTKKEYQHKSIALEVCKDRIKGFSGANAFKIEELSQGNKAMGTKVWFKLPLKLDY